MCRARPRLPVVRHLARRDANSTNQIAAATQEKRMKIHEVKKLRIDGTALQKYNRKLLLLVWMREGRCL